MLIREFGGQKSRLKAFSVVYFSLSLDDSGFASVRPHLMEKQMDEVGVLSFSQSIPARFIAHVLRIQLSRA
jgi:hypothetical protein